MTLVRDSGRARISPLAVVALAIAIALFAVASGGGPSTVHAEEVCVSGEIDVGPNLIVGLVIGANPEEPEGVLENEITVCRDGDGLRMEAVMAARAVVEGPGGSSCETTGRWTHSGKGTVPSGDQPTWVSTGELKVHLESSGGCGSGVSDTTLPQSLVGQIDGTTMSGIFESQRWTIEDATPLFDEDFEEFEGGDVPTDVPATVAADEPPGASCYVEPGLRPVIGVVTAISGTVEVQREFNGAYTAVREGAADAPAAPALVAADSFVLRQGDIVRARDGGAARLVYFEKPIPVADLAAQSGTPLNQLGGNVVDVDLLTGSALCIEEVKLPDFGEKTTIQVIRGAIKYLVRDWKHGSIFSTRAGTTIIGIRGTEFVLANWPEDGETALLVHEGQTTIEEPGQDVDVNAGFASLVSGGAAGEPSALSEEQWRSVVESDDPLAAIRALSLPRASDRDDGGSGVLVVVIVVAAVAVAAAGVAWFIMRSRRPRGAL